jgi:hypothetical protein
MTWPVLVIWLAIIVGFFKPATYMLYVVFLAHAFGGMSLLPPQFLGNVPVETICAMLLIAKTFVGRKGLMNFLNYALDIRKLGLLGLLSVYVVVTSIVYPRLFRGIVHLYALNYASNLTPLGPTSANITQTIYVLISIGMAFVFASSGRDPQFRKHFLKASLAGAVLVLASGFIDIGLSAIGQEALLTPFHTAAYRLLDATAIAGQKRVVGFMPEASVFGAACISSLAFLLFNRSAYEGRTRKWVVPIVAIGLTYMVYASTSSGAYIGMAVIAVVATLRFIIEMIVTKRFTNSQLSVIAWSIVTVFAGAVTFILLPKSLMDHFSTLLDAVIFQKSDSFSYIQRNSWTQAGIAAFWATHGLGVGVGSIRTSNWLVNFAASTGFIGLFLLGSFVVRTAFSTQGFPGDKSRRFAMGLKLALLPGFIVGSLAGTTPDPGPGMMLTLGLIHALRQPDKVKSPSRQRLSLWGPRQRLEPHGGSEAGIA